MNEEVIELTYRSPTRLKIGDKVRNIFNGSVGIVADYDRWGDHYSAFVELEGKKSSWYVESALEKI